MATVAPQQDAKKDASKGPDELFKFSAWVHVGQGAGECEEGETGSCGNPLHFHAWCRLPNQLQHEDIREAALAAKARRIRQLRDPESDASQILASDMDELRRVASHEDLVAELVRKDWWKRQMDAMGDVDEREDFKRIERDRDRYSELRELDVDDRPSDEYAELERHLKSYNDAVEARREELEEPVRVALDALDDDELVNQIREERISAESTAAFMSEFSRWEWIAGTYTTEGPAGMPKFSNVNQLRTAAPEVLDALKATYAELESSLQRGPRGN